MARKKTIPPSEETQKDVFEVIEENSVIDETPKYKITSKFNDETHEIEASDLVSGILSLKTDKLKTRVVLKIEKENKVYETLIQRTNAIHMFKNSLALRIFINRIILK